MAATDSAGGGREGLNKRATGRLLEGEKTPHWKWLGAQSCTRQVMGPGIEHAHQQVTATIMTLNGLKGTGASERVGSRHGPNPPSQSYLALDSLQPASASASARAATFDLSWDSYSSV
uniref:Uncharacterized protein n=1 Tax=Fusarium oxysporum (strain Fo5176) TaxID=660025 RepID=A0A0D2XMG6_FUSOF